RRSLGARETPRQRLMILPLTALEASPAGGRVRITARTRQEEIWVAIEDSGTGIDPQIRQRIFEPFFSTKASGSGLGLPIVHAIVTQHGGAVGVDDSPLGGARFWFTLQRAVWLSPPAGPGRRCSGSHMPWGAACSSA